MRPDEWVTFVVVRSLRGVSLAVYRMASRASGRWYWQGVWHRWGRYPPSCAVTPPAAAPNPPR